MSQESLFPPSYQQSYTHNVLIVGETGAGKSSVINLIAGEPLAETSARADGCTLDAASYDIVLRDAKGVGSHVRLFDTVGLNEPSLSKNDYLTAICKANTLICQLQRTGGVHLLIFCIRGGRITSVMQKNYRLFRDILCQNKVPVAFVITGMENEYPMEGWWSRNVELFKKSKLFCSSHVCVTATRGLNDGYSSQYEESQVAIRRMLVDHISSGTSWQPTERKTWFIHLATKLLKWVTNIKDRRRALLGRSKPLGLEELMRCLEDKCMFSRDESKELASKILESQMERVGPGIIKEESDYYPSDS